MNGKSEKVNVFLTIDTENSIGGVFEKTGRKPIGGKKRIWGKIGKKYYGIPLIMDIADHFGLKLVFFLEVLNHYYFGENESQQVCQYILYRQHDVQAHVHPNYLNFTCENPRQLKYSDYIGTYPINRQIELLNEARDLLIKYGALNPVAYRAGSFGAGLSTLVALKKVGFLIDSSYNRPYCNVTCSIPDSSINDLAKMAGIWEFPITNFIEHSCIRSKRYMPLDINGVSFEEIKQVLENSYKNGPFNITIILHSFSLIKPHNFKYLKVKPRHIVIRRFEKLCRYLANNSNAFEVKTFGSLTESELENKIKYSRHHFPYMPAVYSIRRGLEQLMDR